MLLITACNMQPAPPVKKIDKPTVANDVAKGDEVRLVVIMDKTNSYVRKYSYPDPELFKPLCDKITTKATLDFRYGCVLSNSDIEFKRYYKIKVETDTTTTDANPWLASQRKIKEAPADHWSGFSSSVKQMLDIPPAPSSDVASALLHAVVSLGEENKCQGRSNVRKVLLVCTDFEDSYKSNIPTIPSDIEVISIGILPDTPLEQMLHTPVKRFENLNAAIEYLSSTF
jgi:hypothetical protein